MVSCLPALKRQAQKENYGMATPAKLLESQEVWVPPAAKPLDEAVWQAWVARGRARDRRNATARIRVIKWAGIAGLLAAAGLWFNSAAATPGADLSKYRNFQFGTDLPTVAKQANMNAAEARTIHSRPALIQDLAWRPRPVGLSTQPEAVEEVTFSFCGGVLFRIAVQYDRRETEGLTAEDFASAISQAYGPAVMPTAPAKIAPGIYGNPEEALAVWQDPQYRFDLIRSSYGSSVRLVGVMKSLEPAALAATLEAERLDLAEAPQREAARLASEKQAAKVELENSRLVNKAKFRP
jgi:hypothetical protein